MAQERKKIERKVVAPVVPRKRPESTTENKISEKKAIVKPIEVIELSLLVKIDDTEIKVRSKPNLDKYIRLAENATMDERKSISERVQKGELTPAYYAIDNDKGYHYFLIVKK